RKQTSAAHGVPGPSSAAAARPAEARLHLAAEALDARPPEGSEPGGNRSPVSVRPGSAEGRREDLGFLCRRARGGRLVACARLRRSRAISRRGEIDERGARRMKIVHVIPSIDPDQGGPQTVVVRIAAAQSGLGHEVHIVSYAGPDAKKKAWKAATHIPGF